MPEPYAVQEILQRLPATCGQSASDRRLYFIRNWVEPILLCNDLGDKFCCHSVLAFFLFRVGFTQYASTMPASVVPLTALTPIPLPPERRVAFATPRAIL